MREIILIALLVLALVGTFPFWRYSRNWGFFPSGVVGLVLLLLIAVAVVVIRLIQGRRVV